MYFSDPAVEESETAKLVEILQNHKIKTKKYKHLF